MAKLRLGFEDVLIARPLTWALLKGEQSEVFEISKVPHERVAPLLSEGALDVGLVTPEALEQHGLVEVPDLGVLLKCGAGPAADSSGDDDSTADEAVVVGLRSDLDVVRTVAFSGVCSGLVELVCAWLSRKYGLEQAVVEGGAVEREKAEWEKTDVRVWSVFQQSEALKSRSAPRIWGTDWSKLSFANAYNETMSHEACAYIWALRPDETLRRQGRDREAEFALKSSLRYGLAALPALSRELAAELRGEDSAARSTSQVEVSSIPDSLVIERLLKTKVGYVRS